MALLLCVFLALVVTMRTKRPRALAVVRHVGRRSGRRLFGVNDFLVLQRVPVTSGDDRSRT